MKKKRLIRVKEPKVRATPVIAEPTDMPGVKIARNPVPPSGHRGGRSMSIRAVSLETILRTAREPERWIDPEYHKPAPPAPKRTKKRPAK